MKIGKKVVVGFVLVAGLLSSAVTVYAAVSISAPTSIKYAAITGFTTMQSFSAEDCGSMKAYETIELEDDRANKQHYRVRKMPDGKCWMIDDLKLGGDGTDLVLTPIDSNVVENFIIPANPVTGAANRVTNGICNSTQISASGTGGYLTCDGTAAVAGTDDDENYNFSAYVDPSTTLNSSMYENCIPGGIGMSEYSLTGCGYLYNWYTATAGTGTYDTPGDTATNANAVSSSICPAGWRLPKAGNGLSNTSNDFAVLNGAMYDGGSATTVNNAVTRANFRVSGPFSGSYSGAYYGTIMSQGKYGGCWSSSAGSVTDARGLSFENSGLSPGNVITGKTWGKPVRCVL